MAEDYEMLRACWLSGQISDDRMQQRMADDPQFAAWMRAQAEATREACEVEA